MTLKKGKVIQSQSPLKIVKPKKNSVTLKEMAATMNMEEAVERYDLPKTIYGGLLERAMLAKDVSIRDLSGGLSITYEHVRKLVRGERLPTPLVNRAICALLEIDEDKMENAIKQDKHIMAYGFPLQDGQRKIDPLLQAVEQGWPLLTAEQRKLVAENVAKFLFQNRAHGTFKQG